MPSQTKKITFDTGALFVGRAAGLVLSIVRLNYLATLLGTATFGILNFATYFTSLFQSLFDFGISQLVTREIAKRPDKSNEMLGAALLLKAVLVALSGILLVVIALMFNFSADKMWAVILTTVALAINSVSTVLQGAFQAHRRMVLVSVVTIVNDLLLSVAVIVLLPRAPYLMTALVLICGVAVVNLVVLFVVYVRVIGKPKFTVDAGEWRLLLREGAPIAVASFGISTYMFVGPTMLNYFKGDAEVGIYSAGYKIISILTLAPTAFTQVVFPVFADFSVNAPHKLKKTLNDSVRVMAELSFPLAAGGAVLAPKIIAFVYSDPAYAPASAILRIIIIGVSIEYLAWIVQSFLLAMNKQRYLMWNSLAAAAWVIVGNLLIIPLEGGRGVAIIILVTNVFLFSSLLVYARRIGYMLSDASVFGRILLSALVMAAVVALLMPHLPLLLCILAGAAVHYGLLFVLRVFGDQEREILARILQR